MATGDLCVQIWPSDSGTRVAQYFSSGGSALLRVTPMWPILCLRRGCFRFRVVLAVITWGSESRLALACPMWCQPACLACGDGKVECRNVGCEDFWCYRNHATDNQQCWGMMGFDNSSTFGGIEIAIAGCLGSQSIFGLVSPYLSKPEVGLCNG